MFTFPFFSKRMTTRYPLATTPSPGAMPAATSARLPRSARHQLWHLNSPLLLLLNNLAATGPIRAQQTFPTF